MRDVNSNEPNLSKRQQLVHEGFDGLFTKNVETLLESIIEKHLTESRAKVFLMQYAVRLFGQSDFDQGIDEIQRAADEMRSEDYHQMAEVEADAGGHLFM